MARRRIAYAALVGLAVLFQIFFRFYLSTFTLVLVVLLPVLAAALSLPAALGCTLTLSPAAPTVIRGGEASFRLTLACRTPFPLPRVKVRLRWENRLTGEGDALSWAPAPGQTAGELTVPAAHGQAPRTHRVLLDARAMGALDREGELVTSWSP